MRRNDLPKTILWYRAQIVESLYNDIMDVLLMEVSDMYQIAICDGEKAELDKAASEMEAGDYVADSAINWD